MDKGNKFVRGVKIAVAVLVVLVMSVWSMILYSDAFIDWWIVPAVTLGVGIATAIHMWNGGFRSRGRNPGCSMGCAIRCLPQCF